MGRIIGDLKERTLCFAERAMEAVALLPHEQRGWIVGKQLGRCATSIGANVWEADAAFSDADFASKISIARKEANETLFWVELARRTRLLDGPLCPELADEAMEFARILGTIVQRIQNRGRAV